MAAKMATTAQIKIIEDSGMFCIDRSLLRHPEASFMIREIRGSQEKGVSFSGI